jgi:hypothetical protein
LQARSKIKRGRRERSVEPETYGQMRKSGRPSWNIFSDVHFGLPDASLFDRSHDAVAVPLALCGNIHSARRNIGLSVGRWTRGAVISEDRKLKDNQRSR